MLPKEVAEISKLRFENANKLINTSEILIEAADYNSAANRIYYAVFNSIRSCLILDGFDSKKHSGIISEFRKRYIKTGIFNEELSKTITMVFDLRTNSDYDDFFKATKNEVLTQLNRAKALLAEIEIYLQSKYAD